MIAAAIGIMAPMVMGTGSASADAAKSELEGQVASLNTAIEIYRNFGGRIDPAATADRVIAQLHRATDSLAAPESRRFAGSLVDRRLGVVMLSADEIHTLRPRVVWDGEHGRFAVTTAPVGGVAQFTFDEAAEDALAGEANGGPFFPDGQPGYGLR
jgi:hypothetical protein